MNSITDLLTQQLTGNALSQISQQIGADEGTTGKAISAAVPLLISALARNSSQPEGAQALHQALARDHDGGILDDLTGFLGNTQSANGAGILRHVLGEQRGAVEQGLAQGAGLNTPAIGQLLEVVAPMVMGALGRTQQQQGLDANALSAFLGTQQQMAQASAPGMMGLLGNLLDADKDGSVIDDLGRLAGKLFGGR
jgi:hypothetical protein